MSATTITPKQQSFVRSLLQERLSVLGIDDIDKYIEEKGINKLTARSASEVIDKLKSIPAPRNPEHEHLPEGRVIVNKFAKECHLCKTLVNTGEGFAVQSGYAWNTFHAKGACGVKEEAVIKVTVEPKRAYRCEGGTVAIAYTTQNGRIAVRRLVIHEDGKGSLEYWQGGVAIVQATGTLLTQEEASSLGKTFGFCICCGKDLSEDQSLAVGYGRTCAGNNEWWYPSPSEARDILQRSTGL